MADRAALVRRTEWWLIHQGLPKFVTRQTLRTHTLPRMFPLLLLVLLLMVVPIEDWRTAVAVATVVPAAIWLIVTRAGRRPPPVLPRWLAVLLVGGYVAAPMGLASLGVALDPGAFGVTPGAVGQAEVALRMALSLALIVAVANVCTRYGVVSLVLHSLRHLVGDLRNSFGLLGRALPTLLFIIIFLFFTADIWVLASHLSTRRLVATLAVFTAVTFFAIAARLREELNAIEQSTAPDRLVAACARTPLEAVAPDLAPVARLTGLRRTEMLNILFILGTRQLIRAAVVGVAVFAFFIVFGLIAVNPDTAKQWIGADPEASGLVHAVPATMVTVAVLLAGFSVMYFAVSSMTDSEYRQRYFAGILGDISRVIAVRAVYLALQHLPAPDPPTIDTATTQRLWSGSAAQ
ncbi:hypothetical protein Daura_37280 [Dactylosporangium aurantiacum]|uniref:Integral membrane protein n=1 Tax=Dactylosporangium aurantiacum TaxID=35754 RepID=A0A9Q9IA71_9ACTN|nr:hypothetical protein [Dactylosporangium aurantiacum]MDG6101932.1 hypothetical protein [Dactylosporangium aurantiacum]UWZ52277.1 hypothetical protein Daura_37280 [Dactylosporangium aurantiacum]